MIEMYINRTKLPLRISECELKIYAERDFFHEMYYF